jgi:hypothetical protein
VTIRVLMLSKKQAAQYLGCSMLELEKWVQPDRVCGDTDPARRGMRLWTGTTLGAAKPHVEEWRERDRQQEERWRRERESEERAAKSRRKGMRKAGALLASRACEALQCTKTELDRWAKDGRLPADGEIFLHHLPKSVNARAWLPTTIEEAKRHIRDWRNKDAITETNRRRRLRVV